MRERWAKIYGFKDYMISDRGRVKSLGRFKIDGRQWIPEKILKPVESGRYLFVCLYKNRKQYYKEIHRMVAIAWVKRPHSLSKVNHLDRNKRNNYYKNLEWCSSRENSSHFSLSLTHKTSRYIGVSWEKLVSKWRSQISIGNHKFHLGLFDEEKDAAVVYNDFLYLNNLFNKYSKL